MWRKEGGQGATEYALIIAMVAVAVVAALTLFKGQLSNFMSSALSTGAAEVAKVK